MKSKTKIINEQWPTIQKEIDKGESWNEIAKKYNLSTKTIYRRNREFKANKYNIKAIEVKEEKIQKVAIILASPENIKEVLKQIL